MKVLLAQSAVVDLIAIGRHIALDNPARAESFVQELEQKCRELADMPRAWPVSARRKNKDIRRRAYEDYLILAHPGFRGDGATIASTSAVSNAFPRFLALCTNWKNAR